MACVCSPESLAVVGYEMQRFVSARDEGNSRNEASGYTGLQLSPCRWSPARRCTLASDRFSKAMIRGKQKDVRQSDSTLRDGTGPCGKGHMFRVAATLMKCCEIESAELFLHGRRQLTWLASVCKARPGQECASEVMADGRGSRGKADGAGNRWSCHGSTCETWGTIVEDAEEVQASGEMARVMELEGHGSAVLRTEQAWLPHLVRVTRPLVCWRWSGHEVHASTKR